MSDWASWLAKQAVERETAHLRRCLVATSAATEPLSVRDGRELINLSSNNYLGLAGHPVLVAAAEESAGRGAGSGSSRLLVGHDPAHAALEEKVAAFKGKDRALVLGSGYLANVGVLPSIVDADTDVFSDEFNHASIIDGVRLSRAQRVHRYRHADADHLDELLRLSASRSAGRRLIVTNSVFSMDGDVAPLAEIVELKDRYGAALLIDEAHAGGVYGPQGRGYAHELGLSERVELIMGTFSKAYGVYGAYLAAGSDWIEHLVNSCRTLIYSTGLPPAVIGAIDAAVDLVASADDRRRTLHERADTLRRRLAAADLDTGASSAQIVPVIVGESSAALELGERLFEAGVLALPIREPTVPAGSARLRMSLMATHTQEQLDSVAAVLVNELSAATSDTIRQP